MLVHQTASVRGLQHGNETVGILTLAGVEAETLARQGRRESAGSDIRSVQRPLQAGPKLFNRVRVNAAFAIGNRVIDKGVLIAREALIRAECVGVENRTGQHHTVGFW